MICLCESMTMTDNYTVCGQIHVIILLSYIEVQLVYKIPQEIYMNICLVTSFTRAASSPGKQFMSPAT